MITPATLTTEMISAARLKRAKEIQGCDYIVADCDYVLAGHGKGTDVFTQAICDYINRDAAR